MKKWIFSLAALLALLLILDYTVVSDFIDSKNEKSIPVSQAGLHRMLLTKSNVLKWWPGSITDSGELYYNGNTYTFANNSISLIPVVIKNKERTLLSTIFSVSPKTDLVQLTWVCKAVTSYNPVKRFQYWQQAKKTDADMQFLLQKMGEFYSSTENVYGIKIEKKLVEDSILISTSANCKGYPASEFIYTLIDKLTKHAAANNAVAAGYPMLNIEMTDSVNYTARVALPLNKIIPGSGKDILLKQMLAKGNILVAEVKGGNATTAEALRQINLYARDYQRIPPAIPFFSLVTNRLAEPDSTKWITKVYCPVM
jgi:hypothetical protein